MAVTTAEAVLLGSVVADRFELDSHGTHDALGTIRRRFFHWLDGRAFPATVREELLELATAVAAELLDTDSAGLTVMAEDAGDNVYVHFATHGSGLDGDPVCIGRGLAAVDRLAGVLSVGVVPTVGDRHLLLDLVLPSP